MLAEIKPKAKNNRLLDLLIKLLKMKDDDELELYLNRAGHAERDIFQNLRSHIIFNPDIKPIEVIKDNPLHNYAVSQIEISSKTDPSQKFTVRQEGNMLNFSADSDGVKHMADFMYQMNPKGLVNLGKSDNQTDNGALASAQKFVDAGFNPKQLHFEDESLQQKWDQQNSSISGSYNSNNANSTWPKQPFNATHNAPSSNQNYNESPKME
jgi:hypothetical protein